MSNIPESIQEVEQEVLSPKMVWLDPVTGKPDKKIQVPYASGVGSFSIQIALEMGLVPPERRQLLDPGIYGEQPRLLPAIEQPIIQQGEN